MVQDYTRVLGEHVSECVAAGRAVDTDTLPGWVTYTHHLAEQLKYLVSTGCSVICTGGSKLLLESMKTIVFLNQ